MVGDTSRSEVGRGVSGRPRRRCFEGRRGGRKQIDSTSKAGTTGGVGIGPSAVSRTFQNKKHGSPGKSNILTLTSARGVFSIPLRWENHEPTTHRRDTMTRHLDSWRHDTHSPEPWAGSRGRLLANSVFPGHSRPAMHCHCVCCIQR